MQASSGPTSRWTCASLPEYAFDPELAAFAADTLPAPLEDVALARAQRDAFYATLPVEVVEGVETGDELAPGDPPVRVRVYRPSSAERPGPAILYAHGGGFVLGDVKSGDAVASRLAVATNAIVVSVEYRLAPEHPYPAALDDCYAALSWTAEDATKVAVAGTSAGAALAAGLTLLARDRGGPAICFQLLNVPVLDDRLETPSMTAYVDTPVWHRRNAELSWRHYLGGAEADRYAAPARADDLSGLPPAFIAAAQYDPLRDEGVFYALRLLDAGVPTELHVYPGTFHGSQLVRDAEISRRQVSEMHSALRRALEQSTPAAPSLDRSAAR
jgi:acetyl esterase